MATTGCAALAAAGLLACGVAGAQTGTRDGEWPTYGGDLGHTRYAPLDQIDAANFGSLEVAWRFSTANMGPKPEYRFQSTPLMVGGKLYTTGGTRRAVTALDAATGEQLWIFGLDEGERGEQAVRKLSGRGLAYWRDGDDERILYITPGYRLVALDAHTGRPVPSFGKDGIVDLLDTLDQEFTSPPQIGTHSPPTVAGDVVIVPAAHTPLAPPKQKSNIKGYIRGFDARPNLFGESIVAVDLHTGERRWHYQLVHHGLWDYDIPTAPVLVDAVKDGRAVKALAQPTKQGLLFVLNRETGEPIWPIEERPVPSGNVPGEWYSPTQPIPSITYGHQGVALDDLIDFTPELRAEAERIVAKHRIGPLYTPAVPYDPNGPISTLMTWGGSNWPGGAYDPETKMLYVTASESLNSMTICANPEGSVMPYGVCTGPNAGAFGGLRDVTVEGLPLLKPPYGTIAAIDLTKGEVAWEIPNGETPDEIRNHPALKGIELGRTGRSGQPPGALATKTLLIAAEPGYGPTPSGKRAANDSCPRDRLRLELG